MGASTSKISRPFQGVVYQLENGKDVIRWKNSDLPRNNRIYFSQTMGLLFFVPISLFLSYRLVSELVLFDFAPLPGSGFYASVIIALLCWIGLAGVASSFVRLAWTESVLIDDETIELTCIGPFAYRPKIIPIGDIWRLTYEKYRHNQDQEFRYSVNIVHKRRDRLAYWMRKEEAHQLYQLIAGILQRRGVADLIQMQKKIEEA